MVLMFGSFSQMEEDLNGNSLAMNEMRLQSENYSRDSKSWFKKC